MNYKKDVIILFGFSKNHAGATGATMNEQEENTMGKFEKGLRRLTLAGIGAAAKSYDDIAEFFDGKDFKKIDELAERGKKLINDGKEQNEELHRKIESRIDEFYDNHRVSKREINIADMTTEERVELLERLQNFREDEEDEETEENKKAEETEKAAE